MDYSATRLIQQSYGVSNLKAAPLLAYEARSYLIVLLAALSALVLGVSTPALQGRFVLSVIIAGMLPYLVAFALPRFHLPAIPLLMPLAAVAIDRVWSAPGESLRLLGTSRLWWMIVLVVLLMQVEHFYHLARLQ